MRESLTSDLVSENMERARKANLEKAKERKQYVEQRLQDIEKQKEAKATQPPQTPEKKKAGWW
jgi:hypothetical protein